MQYYLVTFVTHNTRISKRMATYQVELGAPVLLLGDWRTLMRNIIVTSAETYTIPLIEINVLPDHVHLITTAINEDLLTENIQKLKGATAYQFKKAVNWEGETPIWARKFNRRILDSEESLYRAQYYVRLNHEKHRDKWGKELD